MRRPCRPGRNRPPRHVLPVLTAGGIGTIQPSSQARSTMAHSIVLMVTGLSSMFSVQAASHGAGQRRPVNSGKLLVECRLIDACSPLLPVDQVVPVGDLVVDRAAVVTERNAAIHAARGLAVQRLGRQRLDEFLEGFQPHFGLFVATVVTLDFEETGNLTHDRLQTFGPAARRPGNGTAGVPGPGRCVQLLFGGNSGGGGRPPRFRSSNARL